MKKNNTEEVRESTPRTKTADAAGRVPRLRFPEFRETGGWAETLIDNFFDTNESDEKAIEFDKQKIITVRLHGLGVVRNDRTGSLAGGANYLKRKKGQFIFSKIDLLNGAFGIIPDELDGFYSSTDVPAFTFKKDAVSKYFLYWMAKNYQRLPIERTGTSSTLKRISKDGLLALQLWIPKKGEQQKIAACLSSLDELIAAHERKLDTLTRYKKGLMQQLFPAEGETVPRLRFPEFKDEKEWENKSLKKITTYVDYRGKSPVKTGTGIFLVTARNIKNGYIDYEASKEYVPASEYSKIMKRGMPKLGDVLFTTEAPLGNVAQVDNDCIALAQRVIKFRGSSLSDNTFLKYSLLSDGFQKRIRRNAIGSTVLGIKGKVLHMLPIEVPSIKEQQKIASCLSSLDSIIAAQSARVEALKRHKRGLMQGLFPVFDEAD